MTDFTTEYTEHTEESQRQLCSLLSVNSVFSVVNIAIPGLVASAVRSLMTADETQMKRR